MVYIMAKSDLVLTADETVISVVKGEMFATSSNFLENIIAKIGQFFGALLGKRATTQMTITNKRVVLETKVMILWCCPTLGAFETVLPQGISGVSYGYEGTLACLAKKYYVAINQNSGKVLGFYLNGGKKTATEVCNLLIDLFVK